METTEPIRDKKQLKSLANYFLKRDQLRNHVLIVMETCIALNKQIILALKLYFPHRHGDYILASDRKNGKAISRIQAADHS